jgi:hypothetical protein
MLRILIKDDPESAESSGPKACAYLEEHGIEANVAPPPQQEFIGAGLTALWLHQNSDLLPALRILRERGIKATDWN